MIKYSRIGVGASAILAITLMTASTGFAVPSGGIGGRPANPDPGLPRTSSIFIFETKGGETEKDQILIKNASDGKETIVVYAVDGVVSQTGDLTCRQEVEPRQDMGSWIKLATSEVVLEANTEMLVDFDVIVPIAADVGEHNGCIVIQRKEEAKKDSSSGIQLQTRQAVRAALIVPGEINRTVTIDKFTIVREGEAQKYTVGIKNVGNVSADVDIKLVVRNARGKVVYENGGEYAAVANEVRSLTYESNLKPFLGANYTVDLEISYDKRPGSWGVRDTSELITKKADRQEMFFWPSSSAWIGLAGIGLATALYLAVRRRSRGKIVSFGKARRPR